MTVLRNVVFVAAIAGLFAGIAMAVMQSFATTPLIIAAEAFEGAPAHDHAHGDEAAVTHTHGEGADAITHTHEGGAEPHTHEHHEHDDGAWAPQDGLERQFYTAAANVVTAIGFALVLVVASELLGGIASWRQGLAWGFAGFAAFSLAPGLGLPPELPGMPAADLAARQVWWVATVAATAAGLGLVAFGRSALLAGIGVALIVLPHLIGAPQPESHDSAVPAELHHSFVVAVTVTNLLFWLALGAAIGLLRPRFEHGLSEPRRSLA